MSAGNAGHALGEAESLGGTVSVIENEGELLTLTGSNGVPYDFKVTGHTRITIAGNPAKVDDLRGQMNKQATIEFVRMSKRQCRQDGRCGLVTTQLGSSVQRLSKAAHSRHGGCN